MTDTDLHRPASERSAYGGGLRGLLARLRGVRLRRLLVDVVLVALVYLAISSYQKRHLPSGSSPALDALTVQQQRLSLSDYRGEPVLLHFWATWCGVCKLEQHNIVSIAQDVPVVTVASRSAPLDALQGYLREHPMGAPVVADPDGQLARRFGVKAFPTTLILDADGDVRFAEVGYSSELGLRLRLWLAGF